MDKPRIAHCRFYKGESLHDTLDKFDKVVTLAWNYDENTSVLTYAGTVYKKKNKRDHWIKRLHKDEALTRFFVAPVTVQLSNPSDILLTRIGLEWYIVENLIYKFGAYDHDNKKDVYNAEIKPGFLEKYDPRYSEKLEIHTGSRHLLSHTRPYLSRFQTSSITSTQKQTPSYLLNFSLFFIGLGLGVLSQTC